MFVNISFLPSLFSREGSTEGSLGRWAGGQGGRGAGVQGGREGGRRNRKRAKKDKKMFALSTHLRGRLSFTLK